MRAKMPVQVLGPILRFHVNILGVERIVDIDVFAGLPEWVKVIPRQDISLVQEISEWVRETYGYKVIGSDSVTRLMCGRLAGNTWMPKFYRSGNGSSFCLLRQLAFQVPKRFCEVCRNRINSRTPRDYKADYPRLRTRVEPSGFGLCSREVAVCSAECALANSRINQESEAWLRKEKTTMKMVRLQFQSLKLFLKSGSPDAFKSLPREYRPLPSSPSSCQP